MMKDWHGAWAAIATPFREGKIDFAALENYLNFLIENRIDGIVVSGTTGEAATLKFSEKEELFIFTRKVVSGRVPLIAGVGTNDTATSLENARMAAQCGCDGLLIVTPYYNKPNQEGLYRHFKSIAEAVDLPQILYNVPSRTACKLSPETIARLSFASPRIVGIKDATADMLIASETFKAVRPGFKLFSGDDATTLPFMLLGGCGSISVVANVAPRLMHDLCEAAQKCDLEEARRLHHEMLPLFHILFSDTSPIVLKAILSGMGLGIANELRSPLFAMEEPRLSQVLESVESWL